LSVDVVRLKVLLQQRRWQTHRTFRIEYDKAAREVDRMLVGTGPSRAQFHRWIAGEVKRLPYPDHCRVLERMFPGWSAEQLFEACPTEADAVLARPALANQSADTAGLVDAITAGLGSPDTGAAGWGSDSDSLVERFRASSGQALSTEPGAEPSDPAREIGRTLIRLGQERRLAAAEVERLAGAAGNVVELAMRVEIDIDEDGWAQVAYSREFFNMSNRALTKVACELWFENTKGPLAIAATTDAGRHIAIQRIHDTQNLAKFACQVSPPIRPGQTATIGYRCEGGQFVTDHYWRQSVSRLTRHLTVVLRQRGARRLLGCTAVEEHADGSENSAGEDLLWDYEGTDAVITLTRDYLRPNQAVTVRWEVQREPA
jgi:hypothetical protein